MHFLSQQPVSFFSCLRLHPLYLSLFPPHWKGSQTAGLHLLYTRVWLMWNPLKTEWLLNRKRKSRNKFALECHLSCRLCKCCLRLKVHKFFFIFSFETVYVKLVFTVIRGIETVIKNLAVWLACFDSLTDWIWILYLMKKYVFTEKSGCII